MKTKTGAQLIEEERKRQITEEGYEAEYDDQHEEGQLIAAAIAYAALEVNDKDINDGAIDVWPWGNADYKPAPGVRNLVKAGGLIAAEIDRLQRLKSKTP